MNFAIMTLLAVASPVGVDTHFAEGTLRGFPVIRDAGGKTIGTGTLAQWIDRGGVHILSSTDYQDGRHVEETTTLTTAHQLVQQRWSFEERRGKDVLRRFTVDFISGRATSWKKDPDGKIEQSDKVLKDARGAFAGIGIAYAVKNLTRRLEAGETVPLSVVGFTPGPRVASVTVSRSETADLAIAGRKLAASRDRIHPEVPGLVKVFVKAPDQYLWFSRPSPPALLRAEINEIEPTDPVIHIEPIGSP